MTTNALAGVHRTAQARGTELGLHVSSMIVDGARTTYIDRGSGPVVLLLHGAPMTSLAFVRVVRELCGTHRVIAPDLPGFGGSELPAAFGGTLREYARFVVSFVHALGIENVVMYVNDSSGCIGLAAAADLEPGTLRGLVVADTVPIPLTRGAWFVGLVLRYVVTSFVMRILNRRFNLLPFMVACVAPWLNPFTKAERAALVREFDTSEKRDRVLHLFRQMAIDRIFMETIAQSIAERLYEVPALILYGQFDPMRLVRGVARFSAMFPKNRVAIIPWEEHFPILSSGEKVGVVMKNWMRTLPEAS